MNTKLLKKKSNIQIGKSVISSTIGQLGSQMFNFALGLLLLIQTGSSMSFASSQIISPIISLLFVPIIGPTVDKLAKKKIIIYSQTFTIIALVAYAFFFDKFQHKPLVPTLILITILSISDQFTSTAFNASVKGLVINEHQTKLRGYQQSSGALGSFLAPIIGATLYSLIPFEIFVIIEVIAELLTLLITSSMSFELNLNNESQEGEENEDLGFIDGVRYFKKQKYLITLLTLALVMNLCVGAFTIGISSIFINNLGFSTTNYGMVESAFIFGMIVSGVVIGQMKKSKYPLQKVWGSMLGLAGCLLGFGFIPAIFEKSNITLILIMLCSFITAFMANNLNIPFFSWMGENIPEKYQGRIFGLTITFTTALTPVGYSIFGILYDLKNVDSLQINTTVFLLCAITLALLYIVGKFALKIDFKEAIIID